MQRTVLLVAHGSSNPNAEADFVSLCGRLADRTGERVLPAFLEITRPSIPEAVDDAVASGATVVEVLPYFLNPGNHVLVDIPGIIDACRDRHTDVRIILRPHLGEHPGLLNMLGGLIMDQPAE